MPIAPASNKAVKVAVHIGGDKAERMVSAQNLTSAAQTVTRIDGGSIGWLGNAVRYPNGNILVLTGVPINGPEIPACADCSEAARLLPKYDGAFAALFWDAKHKKLVVVTDFLGMQPLYMSQTGSDFLLATETKAFPGEPDLAAWGAFISLGHTVGNQTLMKDVERVPPASVLIYDVAAKALTDHRYWNWPSPRNDVAIDELVGPLRQSVAAYAEHGFSGTLLLSGGFDSRLILLLAKEAGIEPTALIVSDKYLLRDANGRFAKAIARQFGVPYQWRDPGRDFFSSRHYLEYLIASDAATPSLYLFISQIARYIDGPAVWEGVMPGYALATPHQPRGGFKQYLAQECATISSRAWQAARAVFRRHVFEAMYEGFRVHLAREISNYLDDGYGVMRFIVQNRSRNRTAINPYKVYSNYALPFTPGATKEFWNAAAAIAYETKANHKLYFAIFQRLFPSAITVPFISGRFIKTPRLTNAKFLLNKSYGEAYQVIKKVRYLGAALGLTPISPVQSSFMAREALVQDDEWIDADAAERLFPIRTPLKDTAAKLLFHWKAWQLVHQHRLTAAFQDFAKPSSDFLVG